LRSIFGSDDLAACIGRKERSRLFPENDSVIESFMEHPFFIE